MSFTRNFQSSRLEDKSFKGGSIVIGRVSYISLLQVVS